LKKAKLRLINSSTMAGITMKCEISEEGVGILGRNSIE
jgi:hypothetical protein